jgi:hypothetical protein
MLGGGTMTQAPQDEALDEPQFTPLQVRLGLGLVQGLALFMCSYSQQHQLWPATDSYIQIPLTTVLALIPILLIQGYGNVRERTLYIWATVATLLIVGFTAYSLWQGDLDRPSHVQPSPISFLSLILFLFAAHALILNWAKGGCYAGFFDQVLKQMVQFCVVTAFIGVFWGILLLGSALFQMIHLDFFKQLILEKWFAFPATTVAAALALHVTDVRAGLVRSVQNLGLTVLSWLLPLIVLIAALFLFSLLFTGLKPLWDTRFATALLLVSAGWIIFLINTAYQDGTDAQRLSRVQRWAGTIGAYLLLILLGLAGYALYLRICQYGLTVDRIVSGAIASVFAVTAIGYAVATIWPGAWFKAIERWNIATVLLGMLVILALVSPILDPYRTATEDQLRRLSSGAVKTDKFDYAYLRWHAGRFGVAALHKLATDKNPEIAARATAALALDSRYQKLPIQVSDAQRVPLANRITVYPKGKTLPVWFLSKDWERQEAGTVKTVCLQNTVPKNYHCAARMADFDGDGVEDVLLIGWLDHDSSRSFDYAQARLFVTKGNDNWQMAASVLPSQFCNGDIQAILTGRTATAIPSHPLPDILVEARLYHMVEPVRPHRCL